MAAKFTTINKLLNGIMKYRKNLRPELLGQFQRVKDKPAVSNIETIVEFKTSMVLYCSLLKARWYFSYLR
jgi:hypothetical protein